MVSVDTGELGREQKYFNVAGGHRERMRRNIKAAPAAAAHSGAALHLKRDAQTRLDRLGGPDEAVAFGRMDDADGETLYIGNHTIFDDHSEVVVVNWRAPAAERYYTATHATPAGLSLKRSFQCTGNTIDRYEDTLFAQLAAAVAELDGYEEPTDLLLADLESNRTGTMQDIVRTIQAAQFELIQAPLAQLLVIQGGPGTGKTAVALHRVSWLLFNHSKELSGEDVLIVGPSLTFTRYTRMVLPSLGDVSVQQIDVTQLHSAKRGLTDAAEVGKLKGTAKMAGLVRRGLYGRLRLPQNQQVVEIQVDAQKVVLTAEDIDQLVTTAQRTPATYTAHRLIFRDLLTRTVLGQVRVGEERVRAALDPLLERVWPQWTAAAFLRNLYSSQPRLAAAAGDDFTAREVLLLHRRTDGKLSDQRWSDADLAVLDEVEWLLHGMEEPLYAHVVVDEAQDLSPMQLRSIARRSGTGSMTIVGDIAQSTGPWARDSWDDVVRHLASPLPVVHEELRYGYRVPRQVFELAAQLLPMAAPEVQAPQVVRDGPADPAIHRVEEAARASAAVRVAMGHAAHGRSVAIICPASCRDELSQELTARDVEWRAASRGELGAGINLVSPQEVKGLEFDAAVVVEPRDIVAEDERGHRLLYVAMTRTTRFLDVVAVGDPLGAQEQTSNDDPTAGRPSHTADRVARSGAANAGAASAPPASGAARPLTGDAGRSQRFVDMGAEEVVTLLRETVSPNLWRHVLARAAELLDEES